MEENNFSNERKNSPRDSWTAFFQKWMMENPILTFTLVLILLAIVIFLFLGSYAMALAMFLTTLAGIAVPVVLATKGKK